MEEKSNTEQKRIPPMEIRLTAGDQLRFDHYCASLGKTKTELCREAVRYWLDHQDKQLNDERESKLEARMRKMEDRLAALAMRNAIDTGVIYQAIYYNMDDKAEKAFTAFYKYAVERLKAKRKDQSEKTALTKLVGELYPKDEQPKEEAKQFTDPEPGTSRESEQLDEAV